MFWQRAKMCLNEESPCSLGKAALWGYLVAWGLFFPFIVFPLLFIPIVYSGRLSHPSGKKRCLLAKAALFAFVVQKALEVSMYLVIKHEQAVFNGMPKICAIVSANAPSIWEAALKEKYRMAVAGRDTYRKFGANKRYSLGPDGVDQNGQLIYDPTNGVVSSGDIILGNVLEPTAGVPAP